MPPMRTTVATPPVTPLPFGLYSVADVRQTSDVHEALSGFTYEPVSCGQVELTIGACLAPPDPGNVSIATDDASVATITAADVPDGDYIIDWGDGSDPETVDAADLDGTTHDYTTAGDDDYTVVIVGPTGAPIGTWSASGVIPVENGAAGDPVELFIATAKISDDGIEWVESGTPTPHYALVRCSPVGDPDLRARAQAAIDLNEQRAVEAGFIADVAAGAVDLTPAGGAVSPETGAGLLQRYAGSNYGGVHVLHADRAVASLLSDILDRQGNHLETRIGAWLAAGAGYDGAAGPEAEAPGAGEAWMFVTGQIVVSRGDTELRDVPIRMTGLGALNEAMALGERTTTVSYECVAAAVRVLVTADETAETP